MGIINTTPDSFSDGGKFLGDNKKLIDSFDLMNQLGVDYIDIGGESTKPGAEKVSAETEYSRIENAVKKAVMISDVKVSVDTTKSIVAEKSLKLGANMINDISGFLFDDSMASVVSEYNCETVLMHIKGVPQNMQDSPKYGNVVDDVYSFLEERVDYAIKKGISEDKIWIDPGIGFGKTQKHNLELLKNIEKFKSLGIKIVVGVSRKSFIGHYFDRIETMPNQRDSGTVATTLYLYEKGIDMVRVHDCLSNVQALDIFSLLKGNIL